MEGNPYDKYMKMSADDRIKYTSQKQQNQQQKPLPFTELKYPQINFMELMSIQDKKTIKLATYRYEAKETKGVVAIFHGMCLHSGLSAILAERLANEGFTAAALDLMGHGRSQGERGYITDQKQTIKDMSNFCKKLQQLYPEKPLFLLGHGSGALLTLHLARTHMKQLKFAGVILACISLKRPANSKVLSAISDFALKVMPNRTGLFSLDFVNASKNKAVTKYLQKDPLIYHQKVFVGNLMQFMQVMDEVDQKVWSKYETPPVAIIQGECDKIADPMNAIKFYQSIPTKDKEMWYYNNLWNMFYFEEQYPQIQNRIVAWLSKRV